MGGRAGSPLHAARLPTGALGFAMTARLPTDALGFCQDDCAEMSWRAVVRANFYALGFATTARTEVLSDGHAPDRVWAWQDAWFISGGWKLQIVKQMHHFRTFFCFLIFVLFFHGFASA